MSKKYWVIIPAAGAGRRMNTDTPKQYLVVQGRTILEHTLAAFLNCDFIYKIVVVIAKHDSYWPEIQKSLDHSKIITVDGGEERVHSVAAGLAAIANDAAANDAVLVHDAVRPCIDSNVIMNLIRELKDYESGGLLGIPVRDTLKKINENGLVMETISREQVWQAQTPQLFPYKVLKNAIAESLRQNLTVTDEASAIEQMGFQPLMIQGSPDNIKITYPEDLANFERWLITNN